MDALLLVLVLLLFTTNQLAFKEYGRRAAGSPAGYLLFTFLHLSLALVILAFSGLEFRTVHVETLAVAGFFGVFQLGVVLALLKAMETGPASFTSFFFASGLLIPLVIGMLFWGERIGVVQAVGLALLLVAFSIGSREAGGERRKASLRWLGYCLLCFLCNGVNMTLAKLQQRLVPGGEIGEFLASGFLLSALLSLALYAVMRRRRDAALFNAAAPRMLLPALVVIVGVSNAVANLVAVGLIGRMPGIVVFPVMNGGSVLATSVASIVIYREKTTAIGMVGRLAGITALVLLCLR